MKVQSSVTLIIIALVTSSFVLKLSSKSSGSHTTKSIILPVPPTGGLGSLYSFSNVDTLQYSTGLASHLSVLKDGNSFVFLDAYGEDPNSIGWVYKGGFQLRKIELVNGKYQQTKVGKPAARAFNSRHQPGFSKFIKTENGYMAYSAETIVVFDNDLEAKAILHHGERTFISVAMIKGTTEIAVVSMVNSSRKIDINLYDYYTGKWVTNVFNVLMSNQTDNLIMPCSNNLVQTSDGNLFITLKTSRGCKNQIFGKLDYAKMKAGGTTKDIIIWQKQYDIELMDMQLSSNGMMTTLSNVYNEDGQTVRLERVKANTAVTTAEAFNASIQLKKTVGTDQVLVAGQYGSLLPNGDIMVAGIGLHKYGFQHSPVFIRYGESLNILGQYRIPTPIDAKILDRKRYGAKPYSLIQNQHSKILSTDDVTIYGVPYLSTSTINKDYELFVDTYMGKQSVYHFLPGATKDEVFIMTANALLKVNFTKYTPCTVKWETQAEADKRVAGYDYSDVYVEPTPATTSKPTTTNNSASTPAKVTTITIKNDLSADQNTKYGWVKLVFDGGSRATTTLQRGHTLVIDCEDVKGVHVGNQQNTSAGRLLFKTAGNCGKTLNLSNYW